MPLRKMKQKQFKGIYEYYKTTDQDKKTVSYYINVRDENDKPKKIKTDATSAQEAKARLEHYKASREHAPIISNHKLTLSQLADQFFDSRTTLNNTRDKRRFEIHAEPVIGSILISKLSKRDLILLQERLQASTLSAKTINHCTDLTSRIMAWAYDRELITKPLPKLDKLRVDNERQRIFSKEEVQLIFDSTEGETRILMLLAYYTAQRPQSLLRLKCKHIINGSLLIDTIKKQSTHMIPIASKLAEALYPWIEGLDPEDYLITKNKTPLSTKTVSGRVMRLFSELFNKGLNYKDDIKQWASIYTLRHSALTHIYSATGDIYAAQSIANHSSISMTQRYAKRSEELKRNAVDML